jgi:hypothetical protein
MEMAAVEMAMVKSTIMKSMTVNGMAGNATRKAGCAAAASRCSRTGKRETEHGNCNNSK